MNFRVWQSLILMFIMLCSIVGFSSCANPRAGMNLIISSEKIITDEQGNKIIQLVKENVEGELSDRAYATITAQVEKGDSSVLRTVEASTSNSSHFSVSVVFDKETNASTITVKAEQPTASDGDTASSKGVPLVIFSQEDSNIKETVYIQILEKATQMDYSEEAKAEKSSGTGEPDIMNGFAVFKGVPFKFDTQALFNFQPAQAAIPNLAYEIGGVTDFFTDGDTYTEGAGSTATELIVTTYDLDNREDTTFNRTFRLAIYETISEQDFSINRTDLTPVQEGVQSFDLIFNHTEQLNTAEIEIVSQKYMGGVTYSYILSNKDIIDIKSVVGENNKYILQGQIENVQSVSGVTITFEMSYKELYNSPKVYKSVLVRVVNYPSGININSGTMYSQISTPTTAEGYVGYYIENGEEYVFVTNQNFADLNIGVGNTSCYQLSLTVFNSYADLTGAELQIEMLEFSEGYGEYTLEVDLEKAMGNFQTFAENLVIKVGAVQYKLTKKEGETTSYIPLTFNSGTLLYLSIPSSVNETGFLPLVVKAIKNADDETPLSRTLSLEFSAGITEMEIADGTLVDDNTLLMEMGLESSSRKVELLIDPVRAEQVELADGTIGTYIEVTSDNASVATVSSVFPSSGSENAYFMVTAQGVGTTTIQLKSKNGLKSTFSVTVSSLLNTVLLSLNKTTAAVSATQKPDEINSERNTIDTITVKANERGILLDYTILPRVTNLASVQFYKGELKDEEIVSTGVLLSKDKSVVSIEDNASTKKAALVSGKQGTEYVVMVIKYLALNADFTEFVEQKIVKTFTVVVYEPIVDFKFSKSAITLLDAGSSGFYNEGQQSEELEIVITNQGSTVKAYSAEWKIAPGGEKYISLDTEVGSKVRITSKGAAERQAVQVTATLTDVNGVIKTKTIIVTVVKQVLVGNMVVGSYDESEGYYFEGTSGLTQEVEEDRKAVLNHQTIVDDIKQSTSINVTTSSVNPPTNNNLEYFLFDATVDSEGEWTVGERVKTFSSSSIWLGYDYVSKKHFITPISAGYSMLYIVPQDKLKKEAVTITIEDIASLKESGKVLYITVADGFETYLRLSNEEDVIQLSKNQAVWDKNFYVMRDIDLSAYCAINYWTPIGTAEKPFIGRITSYGGIQHTIYGISLETRENDFVAENYYGFFGVVGAGKSYNNEGIDCVGSIENLSFQISRLNITEKVSGMHSYVSSLVGWLRGGARLINVTVASKEVVADVQADSPQTLYIGTIGKNDSADSNIENFNGQFNFEILSTNSPNAIIVFGGAIAENNAELQGNITMWTQVRTDANSKANSSSVFGGAIGKTTAEISNISTDGSILIHKSIGAKSVGGVVAESAANISNCVSSVRAGSAYDVGGIVGILTNSSIIQNCHYEIFEISAGTSALFSEIEYIEQNINVGGIVGSGVNVSMLNCYVKSFPSAQFSEITGTNNVGGLIGRWSVGVQSSLQYSFFDASISSDTTNASVGGLVGSIGGSAEVLIANSFVKGTLQSSVPNAGLFIGSTTNSNVQLSYCYSVLNTTSELPTVGSGTVSKTGLIVLYFTDGSNNELSVSHHSSEDMKKIETFTSQGFDSAIWIMQTQANDGYPIITYSGQTLYPTIPTFLDFSAKDLSGNAYNTSDSRRIVFVLQGLNSTEFSLLGLFDVVPEQNVEGLKVSVTSSQMNVVEIIYGVDLGGYKIRIMGTGTATITITSLYNPSVYEVIGIAVVNGYKDLKLYLSVDERDKQNSAEGYVQVDPTPTQRADYNGFYLRSGTGNSNSPYVYTLITADTEGINVGVTVCYFPKRFYVESNDEIGLLIENAQQWFIDYETQSTINNMGGGVVFIAEDGYFSVGSERFNSVSMTTEQLLRNLISFGKGDLPAIQNAFDLIMGNATAEVIQEDGVFIFKLNSDTFATVGISSYEGDTSKRVWTRSQILQLCSEFAFKGTSIYSTLLSDISTSELNGLIEKAQSLFAVFYSSGEVIYNNSQNQIFFKVDGYGYARISQTGTSSPYSLLTEVFMYVENNSEASVLGKTANNDLTVQMVPFILGVFNTVTDKTINAETENEITFLWDKAVTFTLVIFSGPRDLSTSSGGSKTKPSSFEVGQDIEFDIFLVSDAPQDRENGVTVKIHIQNAEGEWVQIGGYALSQITMENGYNTKYRLSLSSPSVSGSSISQHLTFSVLNSYKKHFTQSQTFRFTISNYPFFAHSEILTKVVYFKYLPEGISYIEVDHYADAELEGGLMPGNYLTNAGAQPTGTILAGEMGLLRINVAPTYAQFDTITVTSNTVNGDIVSFQQRVAQTNIINGIIQNRYYFHEDGVRYLSNGIVVAPVSNKDLSFDGTIWLQTLISKQSALATEFSITITITRAGYDDFVYEYILKVDATSNIELSFDATLNAKSLVPNSFIAVGTGGSDQSVANKNLLGIKVTGSFESVSVPTIAEDNTQGNVSISQTGGNYYIVVGEDAPLNSTFTVQVQGIKYINGYRRTITRSMLFTVTDFVLKNNSLTIRGVSNQTLSQPYYKDAVYKLEIGYNVQNINANLGITETSTALNAFIKKLNDGSINVWSLLSDNNNLIEIQRAGTTGAQYTYAVTEKLSDKPTDYTAINNDYYLRLVTSDDNEENNGWYIALLKQSSGNVLYFTDVHFAFKEGKTDMNVSGLTSYFTIPQQRITLSFTQRTSLDSPIPIYNLDQLTKMEANRDYRLMEDIDAGSVWTPINTAISSLDGNGHTITIQGFNTTLVGTASAPANYGFFGTVSSSTVLKNIKIQYRFTSNSLTLDLTSSVAVNFGGIAGTNKGKIANCEVQGLMQAQGVSSPSAINISSSGNLTDVFNIAGLVGVNNSSSEEGYTGSISNSRVEYVKLSGQGTVAGFVARNYGAISSSYTNYGSITNTATSNSVGATGGFVAYNYGRASIRTSYVGGTIVKSQGETYSIDTTAGTQGRTQRVISNVNAGGFAYSNVGEIIHSFTGVALSVDSNEQLGSVSGGFIYRNGSGGTITRCYSVSYAPPANKAHTPFVGPNSGYTDLNNEDAHSIQDCFFYDAGFGQNSINMTTALNIESLTLKQFINENNHQISFWDSYSTSRFYTQGTDLGEEWTSVWTFLNEDNFYFNIDNFLPQSFEKQENTNYFVLGPRLVSADTIAVEDWESVTYSPATETYTYGHRAVTSFLTLNEESRSYIVSPYLIDSAETLYKTMINDMSDQVISGWYRLISDINLGDLIDLGYDLTKINQATFRGNFEGNGFTISGLNISSGTAENFGLFAQINNTNKKDNNFASLQNLSLGVVDVAASLASKVGALAGSAEDVVLSNIDVFSEKDQIIIGKNIVGGIVGKISGASRVSNLTSSVSVTAVYGKSITNTLLYNADLWRLYEGDGLSSGEGGQVLTNTDSELCYSGGIFGVADLQSFAEGNLSTTETEYNESRIANLSVTGNSKIIGTTSGGVIGLLGASTYATNIERVAQSGAYLKGSRYVGGVVGENHGYLNNSRLVYTQDLQNAIDSSAYIGVVPEEAKFVFFEDSSKAIGGLVGLNVGLLYNIQTGVLANSYNKVNVSNISARVAGGLVGISAGGELFQSYVTGSVLSARSGITGGAIGVAGSLSDLILDISDPFAKVTNKNEYVGMRSSEQFTVIDNVVARNNWSYSDYDKLKNIAAEGSLGGFIGATYNDKISEMHTFLTNSAYQNLVNIGAGISTSSERNFYVKEFYNIQQPITGVSGGLSFTMNAVGLGGISEDVATGLTRNEVWTYSYAKNKGNADINKQVDRMFENWSVYSYGKEIDAESHTFKIINYDNAGMPIYDLQPNPTLIEIWTVTDFNNISKALNANYVLMDDLDFEDKVFIPVGTASRPFTGTFTGKDGKNITHILSNITVKSNQDLGLSTSAIAVFAYTNGASIKDLVIVGINLSWEPTYVHTTSYAGLLVGSAIDTDIKNVQILKSHTRGEGSSSWTGENELSTSAKYVGGAVGNSKMSFKSSVTMEGVIVEADISAHGGQDKDITITTDNQFTLEGKVYKIVGSEIYDIEDNFKTNISGNAWSLDGFYCKMEGAKITCSVEQSPEVFVGGLVGATSIIASRDMKITQSYFQGNIHIERNSLITAGGFVGEAVNTTFDTVFTDCVEFKVDSISFASTIGGFAGKIQNSVVEKASVSGDYKINMASSEKDFYIGGFVGSMRGTVRDSTTSAQIYFNSTSNWSVGESGSKHQMIGGFAGSLGTQANQIVLQNICSITSIHNSTLFDNVDGFAFETSNNLGEENSVSKVYFDRYLSLVSADKNDFGEDSLSLIQASNLGNLKTGGGLYPRVENPTNINGTYYSKYDSLYEGAVSGSKIRPIQINRASDFKENISGSEGGYVWYIQTTNLADISLESAVTLRGFYNGAGKKITTQKYDGIFGSIQAVQDLGLFKELSEGSSVSGLEVQVDARLGFKTSEGRTNMGVLAATVKEGAFVFGCYSTGTIVITSTEQTSNVIGGLVANNSGRIVSSSSTAEITLNGSAGKYFAVGGLVGYNLAQTSTYAFKDCYYTGTIRNNIDTDSQTFVGGIVGKVVSDVSASIASSALGDFALANVYSSAKIIGKGGLIIGQNSWGSLYKNVYYDKSLGNSQQKGNSLGDSFSILSQRTIDTIDNSYNIIDGIQYPNNSSTTPMTAGAWRISDLYNYGLPYLKTQNIALGTGNGTGVTPYVINNEAQLAWALNTSASNKYYDLKTDIDYAKLQAIQVTTDITFKGTLNGLSHYISNSMGTLVGKNNGKIHQLGFNSVGIFSNVVATANNGSISEVFVETTGGKSLIAGDGSGTIANSLTSNKAIDKNGTENSLETMSYSNMLSSSKYDFLNVWMLQTTQAGATTDLNPGNLKLQAFVGDLGGLEVSGTTGTVGVVGSIYTLTISSKEQYSALMQYISRSGKAGDKYVLTLSSDIDMAGMIVPDLLSGKNIQLVLDGGDKTIYNLMLKNNTISESSGLVSHLRNSSSISNLKLNQINLITLTSGGILAGLNEGEISNVTLSNSMVSSISTSALNYIGGLVGRSNDSIKGITMSKLNIVANGGYVGGVVGFNNGSLIVGQVVGLNVEGSSKLNATGGLVGFSSSVYSEITLNGSLELTVDENSKNVGGVLGYGSEGGIITVNGNVTVDAGDNANALGGIIGALNTSSPYTVNLESTVNMEVENGEIVGGVIGQAENSGALNIYATVNAVINMTITDSNNVGGIIGSNYKDNVNIAHSNLISTWTTQITITLKHNESSQLANNNVGGVFGSNSSDNITINYDGSLTGITITTQSGDTNIGGVAGLNANKLIINSLSGITISGGANNVGGVAGWNEGEISRSDGQLVTVSALVLNGTQNVGGVAGLNQGKIGATTSSATINAQTNVGGIVGYNAGILGQQGEGGQSSIGQATVTGISNVGAVTGINASEGKIYNIKVQDSPGKLISVKYTQSAPSAGFVVGVNNGNITGLTVYITREGSGLVTGTTQSNIGIVAGENTGQITDVSIREATLTAQTQSKNVGSVGVNTGTISGMTLLDFTIDNGMENVGLIVGDNAGTIDNVEVGYSSTSTTNWNVSSEAQNIGGIAGNNRGTISKITLPNTLTINGADTNKNVGGIVGYNSGSITNSVEHSGDSPLSFNDITVKGGENVGGVAGYNEGHISGSDGQLVTVSGLVLNGIQNVGGIVGNNANNDSIENAGIFYVKISGSSIVASGEDSSRAGGIAGQNGSNVESGEVENCSVRGYDGSAYQNVVGGVVGLNGATGNIKNTKVSFDGIESVKGKNNVGGIAGTNNGNISDVTISTNASSEIDAIRGEGNRVGGIAGTNTGTITTATLNERIKIMGAGIVGGIVGNNIGTISGNVVMNAIVSAIDNTNSYVLGGIAGLNTLTINATISIGYQASVVGGILLGGVVGLNQDDGDISGASVVFEDMFTLIYYGANVWTYGDEHTNKWTDKKESPNTQVWFNGLDISIQGGLYYVAVGRIIGCNANRSKLCAFEPDYVQVNPIPTQRADYNGYYLRSGNGDGNSPYVYTLITSETMGIEAGETICYKAQASNVAFERRNSGNNSIPGDNVGVSG